MSAGCGNKQVFAHKFAILIICHYCVYSLFLRSPVCLVFVNLSGTLGSMLKLSAVPVNKGFGFRKTLMFFFIRGNFYFFN